MEGKTKEYCLLIPRALTARQEPHFPHPPSLVDPVATIMTNYFNVQRTHEKDVVGAMFGRRVSLSTLHLLHPGLEFQISSSSPVLASTSPFFLCVQCLPIDSLCGLNSSHVTFVRQWSLASRGIALRRQQLRFSSPQWRSHLCCCRYGKRLAPKMQACGLYEFLTHGEVMYDLVRPKLRG